MDGLAVKIRPRLYVKAVVDEGRVKIAERTNKIATKPI